jgi:iron complex outermembrane recepter protein
MKDTSRVRRRLGNDYRGKGLLLGGAALVAFGGDSPSWAQEATQAPHVVEEVVVTARKRDELAQDVPMSISAIGGERLERIGAETLRDIGGAFPGVSFNDSNSGNSEFSIRGLTSAGSGSDTSVGLYVDEVFVGDEAAISQRLFDIDSFQVLRGPQGTLFGRNTVAGAINVVTRKPEPVFGAVAETTFGNYGLRQFSGALNVPLGMRAAARINYVDRSRDGYLENRANPGEYGNDEDGQSLRFHLQADPTDSLRLLLSLDGSRDRTCDNMFTLVGGTLYDGNTDPDISAWDGSCGRSADVRGASLRADQQFGDLAFTSITAYRDRETAFLTDRDFTALPVLETGLDTDESQFTQEFRLASPGGDRLNWVAGLFFYKRQYYQNTILDLGPGFLGAGLRNTVNALADTDAESYAAFGSAEYRLADRLTVELGLRYTYETKSIAYEQTATLPIPGFGVVAPFEREVSGGEWSPTLTLSYDVGPDAMIYGRVARGFKSGGFNAGPSSNPAQIEFQPENLMSYEIGYKARLLDGRLLLDGDVFYMDYEDIQQSDQDGAGFFISNGATARSYGFEAQAQWRLADNVILNTGLGYVDARYEEFGARSGNDLPRAPRWTGSISLDLSHDLGGAGSVFVIPEVTYRGANYVDSTNTELFRQEAHTLVNLRAGFESSDNWSLVVWGRNLTDERFTLGGFAVAPVIYAHTPSPPRTYGVDLRWEY